MQQRLSRRSFLELTGLAGLGAAVAGCSSGPPAGAATWAMWSSSPAEKKATNGTQWNLLLMAATVTTVPLIIIFFLTQRWFVRGITMSGLGGR